MKKILSIEDIEIELNDVEQANNLNIQYISGKGYYIIEERREDGSYIIDFPVVVGIVTQDDKCCDNDVLFYPISYTGNHDATLLGHKTLHETCSLETFEKCLKGRFYIDGETTAEDMIYYFEAHEIKLHPAIYRKYQPTK